jgi:RNA polymerase primary sigma factor
MPATAPSDDVLAGYYAGVIRHPLLSHGEEIRLARAAAGGDATAKRRLVESNLRLVVTIARRHRGLGLDLVDLIQEGNIGLLEAVDRYDWRRGTRFSTYAGWWIRSAIYAALSTQSRAIRLPRRVLDASRAVRQAEADLHRRLGRPGSADEVARAAGVDAETVVTLRRAAIAPVSLSEPVTEGGEPLEALVGDDGAADPARMVAAGGDADSVRAGLAHLPERTRRLLELRYGLDGPPRTLAEVAGELGVSRARVQYLEAKTLRELAARPELEALRVAA